MLKLEVFCCFSKLSKHISPSSLGLGVQHHDLWVIVGAHKSLYFALNRSKYNANSTIKIGGGNDRQSPTITSWILCLRFNGSYSSSNSPSLWLPGFITTMMSPSASEKSRDRHTHTQQRTDNTRLSCFGSGNRSSKMLYPSLRGGRGEDGLVSLWIHYSRPRSNITLL